MGPSKNMLLWVTLLPLCASVNIPGCVPSAENQCVVMPQDETSLLQTPVQVPQKGEQTPKDQTSLLQTSVQVSQNRPQKPPPVIERPLAAMMQEERPRTTAAPKSTTITYGTNKFGASAKVTKIKLNSAGDIALLIGACRVGIGAYVFFTIVFMCLLRSYPEILAYRSCVGYMEEKENPKGADGEVDEEAKAKWIATDWTDAEIQEMPPWDDGFDAPETEGGERTARKLVAKDLFAKKNNWPAPKCARFNGEELYWNKGSGWTTWWNAAWSLHLWSDKEDGIVQSCGLDCAMLLIFTEMGMKILVATGVPMLLIAAPIFIFCGGQAAGKDILSWQGIGNVWYRGNLGDEDPSVLDDVQWIYLALGFATWFVVTTVQATMFHYMKWFIHRRRHWLRAQPAPQNCTLLVELLPVPRPPLDGRAARGDDGQELPATPEEMYWTDKDLQDYFAKLFPDQIKSAYVVKKAGVLAGLIDNYCNIACGLNEEHEFVDDLVALRPQIQAAQDALEDAKANHPQDYYSVNGFVTFNESYQRDAALFQRISDTDGEFELMCPPTPEDVIYTDLETTDAQRTTDDIIGLALIVGLFLMFMPCVLGISQITSIKNIEQIGFIKNILKSSGYETTIGGILASMGLTLMMSFLPTFLMMIFDLFTNKSVQWRQLELQRWYFWFLVTFVLLVTCVGSDLSKTLETLAQRPFMIFSLMANRMPLCTHFYLNYVICQPMTHGMNLTRYITFVKYWIWKNCCGYGQAGGGSAMDVRSEGARFKSEPEDQDYYGIGSRSARFAFMLLMGLVFGTICPLMNVVCFFNFWVCRLVYGYLMTTVESRKNDLGGDHFCQQIKHISESMLLYIILMVGILGKRAEGSTPCLISALALVPWFVSYMKLRGKHWEGLALRDIMMGDEKDVPKRPTMKDKYDQDLEIKLKRLDTKDGKFDKDVEHIWLQEYSK